MIFASVDACATPAREKSWHLPFASEARRPRRSGAPNAQERAAGQKSADRVQEYSCNHRRWPRRTGRPAGSYARTPPSGPGRPPACPLPPHRRHPRRPLRPRRLRRAPGVCSLHRSFAQTSRCDRQMAEGSAPRRRRKRPARERQAPHRCRRPPCAPSRRRLGCSAAPSRFLRPSRCRLIGSGSSLIAGTS